MRYLKINSDLFLNNRKRFSAKMKNKSVAIFNANDEMPRSGDQYFPYRQNADLFYLSGIEQEKTILILAPSHPDPKLREILFIRDTNKQLETWFGHKLTKEEAREISGVKNIKYASRMEAILRDIIISMDNIYVNANEYAKVEKEFDARDDRSTKLLKAKYPAHTFLRSAPILTELRTIKSKTEIEIIQKSCDITEKAFRRVLEKMKPGLKEFEVQAEVEYEFTRNGANGNAYYPIMASGKNACVLHYIENDKECKDGDLILMDFGAEYANYAADLSRTIPVNGKFSKRQKECYEAVLNVHKKAIKLLVVGNTIDKVNKAVNEMMKEELVNLGLMTKVEKDDPEKAKAILVEYFMHGTSHYLGLDVHDVGYKFEAFKEGMIFTCEPGLYNQKEGIGIRIENDILVTNDGPIDLMKNIPIEVEEIEALMAKHK